VAWRGLPSLRLVQAWRSVSARSEWLVTAAQASWPVRQVRQGSRPGAGPVGAQCSASLPSGRLHASCWVLELGSVPVQLVAVCVSTSGLAPCSSCAWARLVPEWRRSWAWLVLGMDELLGVPRPPCAHGPWPQVLVLGLQRFARWTCSAWVVTARRGPRPCLQGPQLLAHSVLTLEVAR